LAERIASLGGKSVADVSKLGETSNDGYPTLTAIEKILKRLFGS
jgi:hypothetical protein